ncbi:MAG: sigma-54-dependent Fis family transcriptional regulator [Deltaproteobacteria bacterium]|nr:MAG: sigma-54-dependent Fis family transcriptional regulator [Deltaproteobacteria bacterium]
MTSAARLLVVDDEANMRTVLTGLLSREGYVVEAAANGRAALEALERSGGNVHAILTDLRMPEMDGMTLLEEIGKRYPGRPVVMLTAHGTVDTAVEAMKVGAFDFVTKPFNADELRAVMAKAVNTARAEMDAVEPMRGGTVDAKGKFGMIGMSKPMQDIYDILEKVADTPTTVLITGESGTGKELVAQALHEHSSRAHRPFIRVNCAAIPQTLIESELFGHEKGAFTGAIASKPGRFELADKGTLFLDEIAEIPTEMQVKLLRAIQESSFERVGGLKTMKVDVRLIAATNRNLQVEVEEGRFREDLFYRLNVIPIHLPPLRERPADIPMLVSHMLERFNDRLKKGVQRLSPEAIAAFRSYAWPGNVREMENVLERLVLFCEGDEISLELLPDELRSGSAALAAGAAANAPRLDRDLTGRVSMKELVRETTAQLEKELIVQALEQTGGNVTRASQLLMISRKSLQNKMKEFNLRDDS